MNATPPLIRAYADADAAVRALLIGIVGEWRLLRGRERGTYSIDVAFDVG